MQIQSVVINFKGGILSPGHLQEMLLIAQRAGVTHVRFGLRQQLLVDVPQKNFNSFEQSCRSASIVFHTSKEGPPNIVSSYPAAGIIAPDSWLREGVYKDIFDLFNYSPQLKINICDSLQCFTPFYSGHINLVSSSSDHFWHLYIRFPKTNKLYQWKELVYTNDLVTLSKKIEEEILNDKLLFFGNDDADGNVLYQRVKSTLAYISKPSTGEALIDFSLPYYEGFNKSNNQLWLGIYRRNEFFPLQFLIDACTICLNTRIGQLYATPWKSIIIKNIEPSDRKIWDRVLGKYRINVRHAANELNWQIEDHSEEGLQVKRQVIRHFDKEDVRTYGLCFAVQTRPASGMFGSVIVEKQQTKNPHKLKSLARYNILYRNNFSPNERETVLFRENVAKDHLGIYLASLCKFFYERDNKEFKETAVKSFVIQEPEKRMIYQCKHCFTVYDLSIGDMEQNVAGGTSFENLPSDFHCSLCEAAKEDFVEVEELVLNG